MTTVPPKDLRFCFTIDRVMSREEPPEYTKVPLTNLTLRIKDAQKIYTNGDSIEGDVVLQVSEKSIPVSRILVRLTCVLHGLQGQAWTKYYDLQQDLLSLIKTSEKCILKHGDYAFPFTIVLDDENVSRCPPTVSDPLNCFGLRWNLEAAVYHGKPLQKYMNLRCKTRLHIEPFDRRFEQEYALLYRHLYRDSQACVYSTRVGPIHITLKGKLTDLPQPPATFDLLLEAVPQERLLLRSITISLRTLVRMNFDFRDKNTSYSQITVNSPEIEEHEIERDIRSVVFNGYVRAKKRLEVPLKNISLEGHQFPAAFSTQGFSMSHTIVVTVKTKKSDSQSETFHSNISSARHSAQAWATSGTLTVAPHCER